MELINNMPVNSVEYVNCTPHDITLYALDGVTKIGVVPRSGLIPRASEESVQVEWDRVKNLGGALVPSVKTTYGKLENCPEPRPGVILIVSAIAAKAAKDTGRTTSDLKTPGKGVRDEKGLIIGACGTAIV